MESLIDRTDGRFALVIHIGCGDAAGYLWQDRADSVILVEPDPLRAQAIRAWLEDGGSGTLVEAAVADRRGEGAFRRTSFGDMNSLRAPAGAIDLFPGLQSLESVPVKLIQPRDLLSERDLETMQGRIGLVVEAPSEVLVVLADLDDAGILEQFDDIIIRVAETPLHDGGADRSHIEAWLSETMHRVFWETNSDDPDIRYALVEPDWKARNKRDERRIFELENIASDLRQSYASASEEAQTNYAALEKAQQDRATLKEEVESVKAALSKASEEAQTNYAALEKAQQDRATLTEEVEGVKAALSKASEEARDAHRLRAQLEALRDDNSLSLRIQRIAQADLADLQERYASLAGEKRKLDDFLDELSDRVLQSMNSTEALTSESDAKASRSQVNPSAKPARKRSPAKSS